MFKLLRNIIFPQNFEHFSAQCLSSSICVTSEKPGDFSGGPVVKTSPPNAGGAGSIPSWEAKIPHALQPQKTKQKT